ADGGEAWVTGVWPGLAVRESRPFPGLPDALAHAAAPPFGGFFVLPPPPELPEEPRFLHLPFQQTQGQLHIVLHHRAGQPRLPSGVSGRAGRPPRGRETSAPPSWYAAARGGAITLSGRRGSTSTTAVHPQRDAALHAAGRH